MKQTLLAPVLLVLCYDHTWYLVCSAAMYIPCTYVLRTICIPRVSILKITLYAQLVNSICYHYHSSLRLLYQDHARSRRSAGVIFEGAQHQPLTSIFQSVVQYTRFSFRDFAIFQYPNDPHPPPSPRKLENCSFAALQTTKKPRASNLAFVLACFSCVCWACSSRSFSFIRLSPPFFRTHNAPD